MIVIGKDLLNYEYFDKGGLKVTANILLGEASIVRYLDDYVYIEEGTTVADIFALLAGYEEDVDFAFDGSLGGYSLGLYLDEMDAGHEPDPNLIFAEFSHEVSFEGGQLAEGPRFGAVGLDPADGKELATYSVELSPVASYKHLEVRLNYAYSIFQMDETKTAEELVFEAAKPFTLHDLLHSLLYEVSYHGTPGMRAEVMRDLTDRIDAGADPTGPEVSNMKETELTRLKERLQEAVTREDYLSAAELRDKISRLEKCKSENDRKNGKNKQQ